MNTAKYEEREHVKKMSKSVAAEVDRILKNTYFSEHANHNYKVCKNDSNPKVNRWFYIVCTDCRVSYNFGVDGIV